MMNDVTFRVKRFLGPLFLGVAAFALIAIWISQYKGLSAAVGMGVGIFLAAAEVGALLGFLFSVPRVLARGATDDGPATGAGDRLIQTNSNLERISDWLTTILLGVGLSQLTQIGPGLVSFREFIGTAIAPAGPEAAMLPGMAPTILVTGSVLGFLSAYLYTRIEITRVMNDVELGLGGDAQRAIVAQIAALSSPSGKRVDAAALARVPSPAAMTVDDGLNVMFRLLYEPDGYLRVIDLMARLSGTPVADRADYWFYGAAAFGQKHAALLASDPDGARSARDNALDCSSRAVKIDPHYAERLWSIATPTGPDNDLATLHDDPEFRRIVGR